jgi:hypothetical protein
LYNKGGNLKGQQTLALWVVYIEETLQQIKFEERKTNEA